jgi:phosphoglycerol transferase MdoB-like AlkP superfamily enzyme
MTLPQLTVYKIVRPILVYAVTLLIFLSLSRLLLSTWQAQRLEGVDALFTLMLNGLRIDISSVAYLLILPSIAHAFMIRFERADIWLFALKLWFFACFVVLMFFELATPAFINEYDLRPNRLFIEYLVYPDEVFSMLVNGHQITLISVCLLLSAFAYAFWQYLGRYIFTTPNKITMQPSATLVSCLLLTLVLFVAARGSFAHRPLNPAMAYFSTDPLINSLTLNSTYSVAFALKQLNNEKNAAQVYGTMANNKIIELVRQETGLPLASFIDDDIPSLAIKTPYYQGKAKNLVIILEESLGAQFVGSLGGQALTPHLDQIMQTGWAFDNLYATGTRSVRGIEAVVTGFTPTPARSVVKLDKSQQNFFTIASLLQQNNYSTQFVYGGESHFDNMKSFFLGNGFEQIIDFDDIHQPEFVASWGASDEDLFRQANTELNKLHQKAKPFFSLIFTSSNHDPFDIPPNKIISKANDTPRDKAIRYADYALGKFIDKAKQQDYWQDTVFLIVADHDARAFGAELVPVKSFHIPGVILNSGRKNMRDKRIVSQIDLAPTLLSLIGIDDPTPMLGYDLTKTHAQERAMMQFTDNFAYMSDRQVAILQPHKPIVYFNYDLSSQELSPINDNPLLGEKALAHALFGSLAYNKNLFRLAKKASDISSDYVSNRLP